MRVECSLGACCSINGVFPSAVAKEAKGSGWTSLFLTGVDERRKANSQ